MLDRLLARIAHVTVHHARLVLALTVVALIGAGAYGFTVFGKLGSEGFEDPGSESARATRMLDERGIHDPDVLLVVTARDGRSVDDPDVAAAGLALTQQLAGLGPVADVGSYWSLGQPEALRSDDGTRAMLVASTDAAPRADRIDDSEVYALLNSEIVGERPLIDVQLGGYLAINEELTTQISGDLARAESIAIPITLILLVLVFGSLVAASLPLLIGIIAIIGSFAALSVIADITDVSVFSINLVTGLGMGLGIDYALLVVSRYREEVHNGASVEDAITATVRRTGRTIVFSGLTVALALAAMMVFPLYFLRSFAYSGIAVVLLAIIGAILVLPAMLMVLGKRVDAVTILKRSVAPPEEGFFSALARRIMHRPVAIATAVIVTTFLVLLGLPFLHAEWGNVDDRALPEGAASRQAQALIREEFSAQEASVLSIVLPDVDDAATSPALADYAAELSRVTGVNRVESAAGIFIDGAEAPVPVDLTQFAQPGEAGTYLRVIPTAEGIQGQGQELVAAVRAIDAPGERLVTGTAATIADTKTSLGARLPWALAIIAVFTFILLFLFTGSIVVPIKALVLNLLSLTAMFGAMVWIFQDGNLSGILGFTSTGVLEMSTPILMFCIAFGLSMDYEVFLLSRIKEEYDRTGDTNQAVIVGLQRTGRIITAAAGLLSIVFLAFATSGVSNIKLMGLGIALAVIVDATLVRCLLVPAFMRLAGEWNWWAPAPLRRLYSAVGISEDVDHRREVGREKAGAGMGSGA